MELKQLVTENRAVSPVIGVILMVAITVILAAVIGTFVLNLGGQMGQTAPNVSFGFDQSDDDSGNPDTVTITHNGGDAIASEDVEIRINGNPEEPTSTFSTEIKTGSRAVVDVSEASPDDTLHIVYTGNDDEANIGTYTIQ